MLIRFADATKEVDIRGNREEFLKFADILHSGKKEILTSQAANESDIAPYSRAIDDIIIEFREDGLAEFCMLGKSLQIFGGKWAMTRLANNIYNLANSEEVKSHWHAEYFEGHLFLTERSLPVVFSLV